MIQFELTLHPLYKTWAGMKYRCYNKNSIAYINYGGRGITVCESWKNSSRQFILDMGPKPTPRHTLDRIDNDKCYSPDNCRWATRTEQQHNMRIYKTNKSGVAGVSWHKASGKWTAQIKIDGKRIYLGVFDNIPAAAEARKQGEIKYWDES